MELKIKNRKVELRQIAVPMIGNTLRIIHVTPKQLEKLNAIPVLHTLCNRHSAVGTPKLLT